MRVVQGSTPVNEQRVSGLPKLLLIGFLFIPSITLIITGFLLLTYGGFSFAPKGFGGAITALTHTASGILTLFLVMLLLLCSLPLDKVLNLIALLKVLAYGSMNLAILPITFPSLLGSCGLPGVSAHGSFLAGDLILSLLASTKCA